MATKFTFAEVKKAVTAAVGFIAQGVSLGIFHGNALAVATAIIGVATAIGVYQAKNAPAREIVEEKPVGGGGLAVPPVDSTPEVPVDHQEASIVQTPPSA